MATYPQEPASVLICTWRRLLLFGVLPLGMSFLGTVLAIQLFAPTVVDAQQGRVRLEQLTVVGDNGADRIHLETGPGVAASMNLLDVDSHQRVRLGTGAPGLGGTQPAEAGLSIFDSTGTQVARIGTGRVMQLEGIGIQVRAGPLRITAVFPAAPAEAAGLLEGDEILAIDGRPAVDLPIEEVLPLLRGESGSTVNLTIARSGQADPAEVAVVRGGIQTPPQGLLLALADKQGQARAVMAVDDDGSPSIRLLDATGAVLWSAP